MSEFVLTGLLVLVGVWSLLSILFVWSYRTSLERTRDA